MIFSRGVGGSLSHLWNFRGGGGVISSLQKWKIQGGGGVLTKIPSVVGVWIFSGTTQCYSCFLWELFLPNLNDFAVIKGLFKCDFTFRSHNYKNIRFRMGYVAMSDEIYENSVFKPLL